MSKLEFSDEEFNSIKKKAEEFYSSLGSVRVPYLGGEVHFNRKGLDHIKFKHWNRGRPRKDQFMRLKLLKLAAELLRRSHTVQGRHGTKVMERMSVNSRWDKKLVPVEYHEFIGVLRNVRIRVITKRIERGKHFFWSIVPYWRQTEHGRELHEGNLETD